MNALAGVPPNFAGAVRCSVEFYERNLTRGDISQSQVAGIVLKKGGYNDWRLPAAVPIPSGNGYVVTLTSVAVSSTRMSPQDMHLFFNARLSKKLQASERVLAIGSSQEKGPTNSLNLLSTEQEQASIDFGTTDTTQLIKEKALPDNYVTSASIECFETILPAWDIAATASDS